MSIPTYVYVVSLIGCDDKTTFFAPLTDEQAEGLARVAALSHEKGGGCRPVLEVVEKSMASDYALESAAEL
jgi:hypothetical protein